MLSWYRSHSHVNLSICLTEILLSDLQRMIYGLMGGLCGGISAYDCVRAGVRSKRHAGRFECVCVRVCVGK